MTKDKSPYLAGKLLLAMPSIGDPRFHRAVIFLCAHDEHGAMGLVINHRMPGVEFEKLLDQLKIEVANKEAAKLPVMNGGPVETSRGFLLHSTDFEQKETIQINDYASVTGTTDALQELMSGNGPEEALFVLGYAGWSAAQLDQELQQNAWLVIDPDPEIIFHDKEDEKWAMAVAKLGFDPGMLSAEAGRA